MPGNIPRSGILPKPKSDDAATDSEVEILQEYKNDLYDRQTFYKTQIELVKMKMKFERNIKDDA